MAALNVQAPPRITPHSTPRFMSRLSIFVLASAAAVACTINHPSTGATGRTAPQMTTVAHAPRDTLFARAFAAMKERGYTEISPDTQGSEVRGKSPKGTSVIVALKPMGDSTQVTVTAGVGGTRGPGIDSEALATVLTLMSDIARPPGAAADSTQKP
jgi:hypothetical protein